MSEIIYPNQIATAEKIERRVMGIDAPKILNPSLKDSPQGGKTGVIAYFTALYSEVMKTIAASRGVPYYCPQVIFFTEIALLQIIDGTQEKMDSFREHIKTQAGGLRIPPIHYTHPSSGIRAKTKAELTKEIRTSIPTFDPDLPTLVIVDEAHIGQKIPGVLGDFLQKMFGIRYHTDSSTWPRQDVCLLFVSATPFQHELADQYFDKRTMIRHEGGPTYFKWQQLKATDRVINVAPDNRLCDKHGNLTDYFRETFVPKVIERFKITGPGLVVCRLLEGGRHGAKSIQRAEVFFENVRKHFAWKYPSLKVQADANDILHNDNKQSATVNKTLGKKWKQLESFERTDLGCDLRFVAVYHSLSAGYTVRAKNLVAWFEPIGKTTNVDTHVQRVGRCFGHNKLGDQFLVFCNVDAMDTYADWLDGNGPFPSGVGSKATTKSIQKYEWHFKWIKASEATAWFKDFYRSEQILINHTKDRKRKSTLLDSILTDGSGGDGQYGKRAIQIDGPGLDVDGYLRLCERIRRRKPDIIQENPDAFTGMEKLAKTINHLRESFENDWAMEIINGSIRGKYGERITEIDGASPAFPESWGLLMDWIRRNRPDVVSVNPEAFERLESQAKEANDLCLFAWPVRVTAKAGKADIGKSFRGKTLHSESVANESGFRDAAE